MKHRSIRYPIAFLIGIAIPLAFRVLELPSSESVQRIWFASYLVLFPCVFLVGLFGTSLIAYLLNGLWYAIAVWIWTTLNSWHRLLGIAMLFVPPAIVFVVMAHYEGSLS
ncbi:MAG: hypothetical protein AAF578_04645 [Pseudomonadota bacterium]